MADTFTFTIKPVTDLSDVKANVGEIQKYFSKLKLPDKLGENLGKNITNFLKEYEKYDSKVKEGLKSSTDYRQAENSLTKINTLYQAIVKDVQTMAKSDLSEVFNINTGDFKEVNDQIKEITKQLNDIKVDPTKLTAPINQLKNAIKNDKIAGQGGVLDQLIGHINKGEIEEAKSALSTLEKYVKKVSLPEGTTGKVVGKLTREHTDSAQSALATIQQVFAEAQQKSLPLEQTLEILRGRFDDVQKSSEDSLKEFGQKAEESTEQVESLTVALQKAHKDDFNFDNQVKGIDRQIQSYFGLGQMIRKVGKIAREAFQTIKELDKAMTETAVVTNFSVGDMWEKLPLYTAEANKLGSSIKDVYEATTLYYQQGLNTTQSMGLAVETLKMARIAGMDAKDATDAMTAALRGFNLEINQASAQRINDVYSELAANTASNTQEISTAMEKVASLAHNAGMELETTSAFLAQMIETTREAPENLGTALKTVVARFQEMKQDPTKLFDSEGVMLDANKVDKALKSIGVSLMDTNGEFRKLDDVFLEIASKWDTLSMGQQRYIATMAAGSRQQSRFIAMMSNYTRTMELVDMAYDAAGASQRQFEKTLEGLDAKLNKLKNAWSQFAMGLMNNELLKGGIDLLTGFLDKINDFVDLIGNIPPDPFKGITKSLTTLILTLGGLSAARTILSKGVESGVGWFRKEMTGKQAITNLFFSPKNAIAEAKAEKEAAVKAGQEAGSAFSIAYTKARDNILKNKPLPYTIQPVPQATVEEFTWQEMSELGITDANWNEETGLFERVNQNIPIENKQIDKYGQSLGVLANKFYGAGAACQAFGNILQGTPLAPFGKALQIVGIGLQNFGGLAAKAATIYGASIKKAGLESVGGFAAMKAGFAGVGAAAGKALLAIAPYAIAIAAIAGIGILIYRELTKDKREMEALAEAAKTSSDAFDNLKTATEELKNSIEDIRNSDSLFDGLVVGTTEWNLALVEANQQILDLIKKYPMLQEYMSTDANGRMHISEAGFKAVQDEQNKLMSQAQALDIYNNAMHNAALTEQEKDKLLKSEGISKTKARTINHGQDSYTITEAQADEINYNALSDEGKRQWESIEARLKAEQEAATKQAMRAALATNGELNDTVLNLFSQNFDEAQKAFSAQGVDVKTMKQAYADFIGGTFDIATGKITDLSGEEIDIDKETLQKMYPQIMAILQFQEQAPQVESAIKSLGKSFDSVFGSREGSNFINDLLDNNLEIDASALEKFMNMSDSEIADVLGDLTDEQIHAIMQSDTATTNDLIKLLRENGTRVQQAQVESYKNAATWYAKSKGVNAKAAKLMAGQYSNIITHGLTVGSADAVNRFMNQISQSFDSATTATIGNNLFSALLGKPEDVQKSITDLLNQVDWTSAIERGKFYETYKEGTDAFKELNSEQQQFIKNQKKVDKELDLTGKQFEELVGSTDFLEILTEKWSDFTNDSGKLDASGVREMANECGTLAELLELDEFNAENLAMALNYFQETGSFDGINSATLAAMKHFDALGNLVGQVQKDIEDFDEGADYSEGVETYRDRMSQLKELYENGQYSNEKTINLIKNLFGEDYYYEQLQKAGSNKALEKQLMKAEPLLTDNLQDTALMALENMANGLDIFGNKVADNFDDQLKIAFNADGIDFQIGDMTQEEVISAMAKRLNVSEELARGILEGLVGQDWGIVGDNLAADLMKNGRAQGLSDFAKVQQTETRGFNVEGGYAAISQSMFDALLTTGGYIEEFGTREAAAAKLTEDLNGAFESLGVTVQTFDDTTDNLNSYFEAKYGATTDTSRRQAGIDLLDADTVTGIGNFTQAVEQLQADGYSYQKAVELIYNQAKDLDLKTLLVDGKEVDIEDILNVTEFNEAIDNLEEASQWIEVGQTIGDTIVEAFREAGLLDTPEDNSNNSSDANKNLPTADSVRLDYIASLEVDRNDLEKELENTTREAEKLKQRIDNIKEADPDNPDLPILEEALARTEAKAENLRNRLGEVDNKIERLKNKTVNVNVNYNTTGAISGPAAGLVYKGKNNYISSTGFYAGSSARGRYGTVGPKDNGGLTLTGEKGFEIAWLPSENRSMIVGAHGPQMLNLPSDAVVYTHEQSKKIISQKAIPAGSHAQYDHSDYYSGGGSSGSSSGSGSGSKSSSSKDKDPKHSNWYKEEVRRFNLNQSINQITEKIEKAAKNIADTLKKLGAKYSDISKDVDKQVALLTQTISIQEQLMKSYRDELEWLANGNRQLWVNLTDANNESQEVSIGTSQFISGNADTGYSVSYDAIVKYLQSNGYGGENLTANAEALFNLLQQQISSLQSSFNAAAKAIEDAQQKLKDLVTTIKDTFYAWENELTEVYNLTKQLELNESRNNRFTSETSLLLSGLIEGLDEANIGFLNMTETLGRLHEIQVDSIDLIKERLNLLKDQINAEKEEIAALMDAGAAEKERWLEIKKANQEAKDNNKEVSAEMLAREAAAYDAYAKAAWGQLYVTTTEYADGSYTFDFNVDQLEKDKEAGLISEDTYNAIKEGFDKINESQIDYNDLIAEATDYLAELQDQLQDHYKTMADLEGELIDAYVEMAEKEVKKLESLNSSLTNAAKSVLDQVKKNIDARRKAEDNAKTEADIAKKQERLAALRANTGGGNQVEIAQLEKEIGDAQRSYGRTLEDQMLAQMQTQADEASKQRQQQIDLAKQQIEYNKQAGIYAAMADELLTDIETNNIEITNLLSSTQDMGRGYWQKLIDNSDISNQIIEAANASGMIPLLQDTIETEGQALYDIISQLNGTMMDVVTTTTANGYTVAPDNPTSDGIPTTGGTSSGGSGGSSGGSSGGTTNVSPNARGKLKGLPEKHQNTFDKNQRYALQQGLNDLQKDKLIAFDSGRALEVDGIIGPKTTAAIVALQKVVGTTQDGIWGPNTGSATHKKFPKYARGGLNKKTGPAWLDGTPTKPELILNAQDTKNFIALKDILSGVMRTISHTDTSNIYNSPTNFEINVNVDKISNDYDVDRLTERIKRNIVKDATYRNVTQVRNFR